MLDALYELARKQLENQFLTGGLTVVVFTATLAALRNVPAKVWTLLKRKLITTVDIADHDPAFFWVQKWLGQQEYTKRARLLTASTRQLPVNHGVKSDDGPSTGRKRVLTEIVFSPAPGWHLFWYKHRLILLTRTRREADSISGEVAYHESITFQAFSRGIIQDLIYEAREQAFPPEDSRIAIFRPRWDTWRIFQRRLPRPLDSVILGDNILQSIYDDVEWFFGAAEWYTEHGIPYQRGHLLVGPPGNGKSSLVVALAGAFRRDVYMVNLSTLTDSNLSGLMGDLPEHAIVLIEDIDSIFDGRKRIDGDEGLTFSGFINAIDGVSASPGRVLFMTTNHPEKLDEALKRRGRMDVTSVFKNATPDQARRLYLRFFPADEVGSRTFEAKVLDAGREFSMSDLQEHLIQNRSNPLVAQSTLPV